MTLSTAHSQSEHAPLRILILGASYGSLFGIKCLMAGHHVTLTCRSATAALIKSDGIRVRLPVKLKTGPHTHEVHSKQLTGQLQACTPDQVTNLAAFDLVVLAMQEPQYRQEGIRQLMQRIGQSGLPCMPIMNMPPLPYLARLKKANPSINFSVCREAYADASIWDVFTPEQMTLSSPDPQAFRPADEPVNVLQVALPTNFKAAAFESAKHTEILRQLETDIEAVRATVQGEAVDLPVKLKVFDSLFVPLAKWSMLLAGNYRCIQDESVRSIQEAVQSDAVESENVYNWVRDLCIRLGAMGSELVAYEKYVAAAAGLSKPSSAARALVAGATHIERVDLIVQALAVECGMSHPVVNQTVNRVNAWLDKNRQKTS